MTSEYYLIRMYKEDSPAYVAVDIGEEEIFVWFPQLERFVYSFDQTREFRDFMSDTVFEPITSVEALRLVEEKEIGAVVLDAQAWMLEEALQEERWHSKEKEFNNE